MGRGEGLEGRPNRALGAGEAKQMENSRLCHPQHRKKKDPQEFPPSLWLFWAQLTTQKLGSSLQTGRGNRNRQRESKNPMARDAFSQMSPHFHLTCHLEMPPTSEDKSQVVICHNATVRPANSPIIRNYLCRLWLQLHILPQIFMGSVLPRAPWNGKCWERLAGTWGTVDVCAVLLFHQNPCFLGPVGSFPTDAEIRFVIGFLQRTPFSS